MTRKAIVKVLESVLIVTQMVGIITVCWVCYLIALGSYERSLVALQQMLIGKN